MAKTSYYTVNGQIIGERTAGVRRNYGVDALGSVTSTIPGSAIENTYAYRPYGDLTFESGTASDPRFKWSGLHGYSASERKYAELYVRARTYTVLLLRWTTVDPLWPREQPYQYCAGNPNLKTDPSGRGGGQAGLSLMVAADAMDAFEGCWAGNTPDAFAAIHGHVYEWFAAITLGCIAWAESANDPTSIAPGGNPPSGLFQLGRDQFVACTTIDRCHDRILDGVCNTIAAANLAMFKCRRKWGDIGVNWGVIDRRQNDKFFNCMDNLGYPWGIVKEMPCPKTCKDRCNYNRKPKKHRLR